MSSEPFTVVVTSCRRFDLLRVTLESLNAMLDERPERAIVIEDSDDDAVRDVVARSFPDAEVVLNAERLGQMASIDKAFGLVTSSLIFHCEDDWRFTRGGFIGASRLLLDALPDISMVGLRARDELNPLLRARPDIDAHGVRHFLTDPTAHPEYFSHSFNPGLRRLADYRRIGPYAPLGHEADVSYAYKKAGFRMAYLSEPVISHIGGGRHVDDPRGPKRPTGPLQRAARSIQKRVKRARRALAGA
ncbi:MAG: glycosyltransferase [Pseudomonadota bacterium]